MTEVMETLIPKLSQLLEEEYNLQKGMKQDIKFLVSELPIMHFALRKVANIPPDQLDPHIKHWTDQVRDLSYVMEDFVDNLLVMVEGSQPAAGSHKFKELLKKMGNLLSKGKARRKIANKIKEMKILVKEVTERHQRYRVDDVVIDLAPIQTVVDPRLVALYKDQKELVGINVAREEIMKILDGDGDAPNEQLKILSICGAGGLGKTTLAKAVRDRLKGQFMLMAFIPVGHKPDVKKVLCDIFFELDKECYTNSNALRLDLTQLIEEIRKLLKNKRYFIVIDDVWDINVWKMIKCAFEDCNCGSRIITTTRILDVAICSGEVYRLKPLSQEQSENLFYTRLYGDKRKRHVDQPIDKILQKCGGVPLAIITIASLLDGKPREDWSKVYESVGFGHEENKDVDNTRKILLFSYYDLPYYLRPCLLYLSVYPAYYSIPKDTLIWKWVAEGFIKEEQNIGQYELGERYFSELVNRNMIQPIEPENCRADDLVLDMIRLLSEKEKFVKVLDNDDQNIFFQDNARRLAIHKRPMEKDDSMANMCMTQVRSFSATACDIRVMPSLSNFAALRVLAIESCTIMQDGCHLTHLGSLVQLRYLGLQRIPIYELPAEIGKLKFLQTLDLRGTRIKELPQSIGQLSQLKCLYTTDLCQQGMGGLHFLGNLTSLEDLSLEFNHRSPEFAVELGKLTELRRLSMYCFGIGFDASIAKVLVESLGKLKKIQDLHLVWLHMGDESEDWLAYVPPPNLRGLTLKISSPNMFPAWINPSLLPIITRLSLALDEMTAQHLELLGSFPALASLTLNAGRTFLGGGGLFPQLRYLKTNAPLSFQLGTMPKLEHLVFRPLFLARLKSCNGGSFVFEFDSLRNLRSLQKVEASIVIYDTCEEDFDQAKDALQLATNAHPNRPSLLVSSWLDLRKHCNESLPAGSHTA